VSKVLDKNSKNVTCKYLLLYIDRSAEKEKASEISMKFEKPISEFSMKLDILKKLR